MLCSSCSEAVKISEDRFDTKARKWHDRCRILVEANGQKERCGCPCNINTLPSFNVIAELEGDDAEAFLEYDTKVR